MGSERRRRAMALIMVVMVLAILVVIGTPFAVSMLLQEKSGHSFLEDARARFAAEGARNHAVAQLAKGHDTMERSRDARSPWNDPYGDGVLEASAELLDLANAGLTVADPKGPIWGVDIEDEQGKLNSRTVPARVISVLDGLIAGSPVPRWHYVTEHSQRPACWVLPQAVRSLAITQNGLSIGVDDWIALRWAQRFRLTKGREQLIGTFAELTELLGRRAREFEAPGSTIELEAIHPVNPNVAPREVLAAVFTGLYASPLSFEQVMAMLEGGQPVPPAEPVTPDEAMALAAKIVQREQPFRTPRDFFDFVAGEATSGTIREIAAVAIVRNSMNPYDNRLFDPPSLAPLGTAPFCYDSQNVWLVEATGVANNPAGNEAGKRVIRDVVEVAPAEKLTWAIESQCDFDREMWRGQGGRVVTWPERSFAGGDPSVLFLGLDQRLPAVQIGLQPSFGRAADVGHLTLRAPQDRRDPGSIKWKNSWDDRHEGADIKGTPMTFQPQEVGIQIAQNAFDIDAGGLEFWVKFDARPNDTFFLDMAQKEWENRLSFKYDGSKGELVVSACDACVDKLASQVRYPVTFDRDTWYHLGAVWKGTKYALLSLSVDGFPKGTFQIVDDKGVNSVTQLTAALTETDTSVSVKSTAGYPNTGVIEVGDEAIEYTGKSGSSFTGCIRGARQTATGGQGGTTQYTHGHVHEHPAGAGVAFYGYANRLRALTIGLPAPFNVNIDRIPVVKGTVREDFGADPIASVGQPQGIRPTDTTIVVAALGNPAPPTPTQDFPRAGYIQVGTEVVYYASKQNDRFEGCLRGQFGTTAGTWPRQTPVAMWAIPVSDVTGYLDPGIVQIDDEWIVGRPEPNGEDGAYIAGFVVGGIAIPMWRGFPQDPPAAHTTGAKVIPVFATRDPWCGAGDLVTIVTANQAGAKEQMTIHRGQYIGQIQLGQQTVNINAALAAFNDFQKAAYQADNVTRLMKFPSGELMSVITAPVSFGAEAAGVAKGNGARLVGTVDDLRFFASNKGAFWTEQQVLARDTSVIVSQAGSNSEGVIKLGDELIGYVGSSGGQPLTLANAKRGYLKSPAQGHGTGERFINMQFFPISSTSAAITEKDSVVPVNQANGFAPVGYVLIDDEVIGYHDTQAGLEGPVDKHGDGVFRGRFGTTKASHDSGSLVYAMPFRYFDFSRAEAFDNQMAYWQGSLRATGAKFLRLRWEEERRHQKAIVRVLARVDGKPNWDEVPSSRPGALYEFTGPDGRNAFDVSGNELQVQIRFEYEKGAFEGDTWKYSPQVTGLWVEYEQPEVVRSHEEE